jgi:hypothetical protein
MIQAPYQAVQTNVSWERVSEIQSIQEACTKVNIGQKARYLLVTTSTSLPSCHCLLTAQVSSMVIIAHEHASDLCAVH